VDATVAHVQAFDDGPDVSARYYDPPHICNAFRSRIFILMHSKSTWPRSWRLRGGTWYRAGAFGELSPN